MSNSIFIQARSLGHGDNNVRYVAVFGSSNNPTVTGEQEAPIRQAGIFSNLFVYSPTNTASVNSTVTLQKSQVDTALLVTYGADQTGIKENTSDTVSFAATDEAQWEVTVPNEAGSNTLTINLIKVEFAPDTAGNSMVVLGGSGTTNYTTASATRFINANGTIAPTSSETFMKWRARLAFASSNLWTYVTSNARTTDTTFTTRKNGAAGGQITTYTSGQTGAKEDTSGTDSIAVGDDFDYAITTLAGTEQITFNVCCSNLVNTGGLFPLVVGSSAGAGVAAGVTTYYAVGGGTATTSTIEADYQMYPRFTFTAQELGVMVSAFAGSTGSATITLRDNGAGSGISVNYTVGQTGLKNDSVNTSEITSGTDEIDYEINNGANGTITITWMSILGATVAPAGRTTKNTRDHAMNYMLHHSEGFGRRIGGARL